jgi:hypothetical protein
MSSQARTVSLALPPAWHGLTFLLAEGRLGTRKLARDTCMLAASLIVYTVR